MKDTLELAGGMAPLEIRQLSDLTHDSKGGRWKKRLCFSFVTPEKEENFNDRYSVPKELNDEPSISSSSSENESFSSEDSKSSNALFIFEKSNATEDQFLYNHILSEALLHRLISRVQCESCQESTFCKLVKGPAIGITMKYVQYECSSCGYRSADLLHTNQPGSFSKIENGDKLEHYSISVLFFISILLLGCGGTEAQLIGSICFSQISKAMKIHFIVLRRDTSTIFL